jgi:hemolysin activation/secretion protein
LSGSRLAIINAELRIPLFGTRQFGLIPFSLLPIEVAPFVDAGLAWSASDDPALRFAQQTSERVPVVSAGVSGRANLFGFAVLEVFWARPFQRPTRGGLVGFQLQPGW